MALYPNFPEDPHAIAEQPGKARRVTREHGAKAPDKNSAGDQPLPGSAGEMNRARVSRGRLPFRCGQKNVSGIEASLDARSLIHRGLRNAFGRRPRQFADRRPMNKPA